MHVLICAISLILIVLAIDLIAHNMCTCVCVWLDGCAYICVCVTLKLNVFAWMCYGHWIAKFKYRWFLYFFLRDQ